MEDKENKNRWALESIDRAIVWTNQREQQNLSVALDPLGEYAQTAKQAEESSSKYLNTLNAIKTSQCNASLAVKLSSLGLSFNRSQAEKHLQKIIEYASKASILVEIDIEGTPTVPVICEIAQNHARAGKSLVLALQAYLDRSTDDLRKSLQAGLKIRLVKGAYRGDSEDFVEIQNRFINLFDMLLAANVEFDVGTHDPEILKNMGEKLTGLRRSMVCFGFLKGLAENTKARMIAEGFKVSEYVPFGDNRRAYITRRHIYLKKLSELGRMPAL